MAAPINGQMRPAMTNYQMSSLEQVLLYQGTYCSKDDARDTTRTAIYVLAYVVPKTEIASPTNKCPIERDATSQVPPKGRGARLMGFINRNEDSSIQRQDSTNSASSYDTIDQEKLRCQSPRRKWRGKQWRGRKWAHDLRKAKFIEREPSRFPRKATLRKHFDASTGIKSSSSRVEVPAREANVIPVIAITPPDETLQTRLGADQVEESHRRNTQTADQIATQLPSVSSSLERLSVREGPDVNIVQQNSGRSEMEMCDVEAAQVPDVECSDESDIGDDTYWEWDLESERFQHWDEERKIYIFCPDEFD